MGLLICDFIKPWNNNFKKFLKIANKHEYMLYVGAGWAVTRLPFKRLILAGFKKDILYPLICDGIGFYEGYFNWKNSIIKKNIPNYLNKKEYSFYDQGLGRSLWFVLGGNANRINDTINNFSQQRRGDLWSGIGLAGTYAGGREDTLISLKEFSGEHYPELAQGCTFASKARLRADNVTIQNKYACKVFCDMTIEQAAKITDDCFLKLKSPSYKNWRINIKKIFEQ